MKQKYAGLLLALLLGAGLSGCLRNDPGTVIGAVSTPSPAPVPTETPAPTPEATPESTPLPANYHEITPASADSVTLAFAGDVNFADDWALMEHYAASGSTDFADNFSPDLLDQMRGADIFLANNEFCISDRGEALPGKDYTFRAQPASTACWQTMGVDLVGLANNHAGDFGTDALLDTLDNLAAAGIPAIGAGRNVAEAQQAQYYIANGMTIAYVAASRAEKNVMTPQATADAPGVLYAYDPEETLAAIREAKANADFVIAYLHWGTEESDTLEQEQLALATACEEAGADLIVGSHPHVLQGAGWRNDTPVFYSLGNFWFNMDVDNTGLLVVTLRSPQDFTCKLLPCQQQGGKTELLTDPTDYQWVLTTMNNEMEDGAQLDAEGVLQHTEPAA